MKNVMLKHIEHHLGTYAAMLVICVIGLGCALFPSTAPSPSNPSVNVTRDQLQAEVDTFIIKAQSAADEIARKDEIKRQVLSSVSSLADVAGIPHKDAIFGAASLLLLGAGADNVRKNLVIKKLKTEKGTKK